MTITANDMRPKLLTVDQLRETLATTEPVSSLQFAAGDDVSFRVSPGWEAVLEGQPFTKPVDAFIKVGTREMQLTADALLEATSACGLNKGYVQRTPAKLTEDALNYWFQSGLVGKSYQVLGTGEDTAAAINRATLVPFSNSALLDVALTGIKAHYGDSEVLVDYKMNHSLQSTNYRLIVPEHARRIASGRDSEENPDNWSVGVQVTNSLTGVNKTDLRGYLFAWWCTNGATNTEAEVKAWSRRGGPQTEEEVMAWAGDQVDQILGGLEHHLDQVEALNNIPVEGDVVDVLRDVFTNNGIPNQYQSAIVEAAANSDVHTMYDIMQAVTSVANGPGIAPGHINQLLAAGGELPALHHTRCDLGKIHSHA